MSTHGAVAIPTGEGQFKGRYVHFDGYPAGLGVQLVKIIEREGVEKALRVLVHEHYGWSSVESHENGTLPSFSSDGRFEALAGFGRAYTDTKITTRPLGTPEKPYQQVTADEWVLSHDEESMDAEWAYVVHERGINVYVHDGVGYRHVGDVPLDANAKAAMRALDA